MFSNEWVNTSFQGINATKALSHVLGKKGLYINSSYVPKDKSHITRYQELQHDKQTCKVFLIDHSENIKESIRSIHNKSSTSIKSTIYRSSKSIISSNETNSYEVSGFISALNITSESN